MKNVDWKQICVLLMLAHIGVALLRFMSGKYLAGLFFVCIAALFAGFWLRLHRKESSS